MMDLATYRKIKFLEGEIEQLKSKLIPDPRITLLEGELEHLKAVEPVVPPHTHPELAVATLAKDSEQLGGMTLEEILQDLLKKMPKPVRQFIGGGTGMRKHGREMHISEYIHHLVHISMEQGVTNVYIKSIPAGTLEHDLRFSKVVLSLDEAPGSGKSVSVTLSNGTDNMTVTISNDDKVGLNEDAFDLDVSEDDLTITYSQTAGGLTTKGTLIWFHKEL